MNILLAAGSVVLGFVLLVKGADFFVEGASAVAYKLKVPGLIIGMTVVAMGTSLPELSVSITSSLAGANTLAVSNVVGSNIFNLMVVLGISALFNPLKVAKETIKRDFPFSTFAAILMLVLGFLGFGGIFGDNGMALGRIDGIIFLVLFIIFLVMMIKHALKARAAGETVVVEGEDEIDKDMPMIKAILFIVLGAVAVKFGGDFVVNGAVEIASSFGVSQTLIGLTIVACGTSLPELATSIAAARKNELDMAIGNVVGSNIFNILLILGTASSISQVDFLMENIIDIAILLVFSLIVWIFCATKKQITRPQGIIMLLLYVADMVYVCIR
ncbi:MAG: calcium/sodium antiporter [Lachnospiraceae bacterium]|nr:calcium/sodium antiporter [Lachnospiraceae bacterium]